MYRFAFSYKIRSGIGRSDEEEKSIFGSLQLSTFMRNNIISCKIPANYISAVASAIFWHSIVNGQKTLSLCFMYIEVLLFTWLNSKSCY